MIKSFTYSKSRGIRNSFIGICPHDEINNYKFSKVVIYSDNVFSGELSLIIHDESITEEFDENEFLASTGDYNWEYTYNAPNMSYDISASEIPELATDDENMKNPCYCNTSMIKIKTTSDLPANINVKIDCHLEIV